MPTQAEQLRLSDAFTATNARGLGNGNYHPCLVVLRGEEASGVYAIIGHRGEVLYYWRDL